MDVTVLHMDITIAKRLTQESSVLKNVVVVLLV